MKTPVLGLVVGFLLFSFSNAMAIETTDDMQPNIRKVCETDIQQFCKDITPGEGRVPACLKSRDDKISAGCKEGMEKDKQAWKDLMTKMTTACGADIQKFCQESETIKDVMSCLGSHTTDLSSACKTFQQEITQSTPGA